MTCERCNAPIVGRRSDARYCSPACKNAAKQLRRRSGDRADAFYAKRRERYHADPEHRDKQRVRVRTRYHHPTGQPCSECGATERVERHHNTYTVDDFVFLCRSCHVKRHPRQ